MNDPRKVALIIDDNMMNIDVLSVLLEASGLQSIALSQIQGFERALDELPQIDLIFLDLRMPKMSGYTLLETIKKHPRAAHIPVVAYTVHQNEQVEARRAGFHSFLGKPLNASRFPDQIARILNGEPVWEV